MRPSILSTLSFVLLGLVAACDNDPIGDPPRPAVVTAPTDNPPTTTPPTSSTARTLVTARAMGTRDDNLVVDPTFGSVGEMDAATIYTDGASLLVEAAPTSPAGLSQDVLRVTAETASPAIVMAVQGGADAVDASVFVATEKGVTPSVYLSSVDGRDSFELPAVTGKEQIHGDLTYVLYAARVTKPIYGKLYLVIETGKNAIVAAPDVAAVTKISKRTEARRVALSANAARVVHAFASKPVVPGPIAPDHAKRSSTAGRILSPQL